MQHNNAFELPPIHNIRSPEQWKAISATTDFDGRNVIDLGCGHADLLWRALRDGAYCLGVDNDKEIVSKNLRQAWELPHEYADRITFLHHDVEDYRNSDFIVERVPFDYFFCFSVLPYLEDPRTFLSGIYSIAPAGFLEVQYLGDGPGRIKDDAAMHEFIISCGWYRATVIGRTLVEGRDMWRSIWFIDHRWKSA